ncbi:Glyceraldehyde-3-phosphate dehydrogenase-like protein [Zhongshania aliphaticivorans]|uniref:Glyceraldehyde-3-phosphate dehydrogenase n=1 Tax=Zhongshania aliphaticivorans TaxID=1470434 RepID=A0A5S9QQI2_9GAMM|nr:glyceraldehyde-3-phosphate dehydrogenase [Zhongshania aliphaticivorans]CAA0088331.1 Glyceraldehyde-3-phosphate dehydrogenase-like protein [Zhongshania aliphaticivorans]CAA0116369.1 Glyceraldehyde-3-phosphate dehydrogenase-like protein [Zhongshania aliphaticivorans]CAA0120433.1 Glyceraldehyde-3-phosphate dehydrogenase-like protein [Zhongshania aliphaticivorans]
MTERRRERPDDYFADWKEREALAEGMIPLIGKLYRANNVKTYIYGKNLVNLSVLDIMQAHRFVRQVEQNELSEFETFPIIQALATLDLGTAHIDAGRIAVAYEETGKPAGQSVEEFVRSQVSDLIGGSKEPVRPARDVVLYGFGRIGRLVARLLIEKAGGGENLRLKAVVVRQGGAENDLVKRVSLLRRDSVHGPFNGTIRVDEERQSFVANGVEVKVIYANSPSEVDYTKYGINDAILVDNTGKWRDAEGLSTHLACPGISKVILTAPGKGDMKNIVHGVNSDDILPTDTIISAASCTTNAIAPPLKVLDDKFGVDSGHVETVHSYTNDQNLIDNYHKGDRRGRSAPLNMVISETGAAKAVGKVLPQLLGKLSGNAIRVPTPNVSLAILKLNLKTETTVEELNEFMRRVALHSPLRKQIDYSNSPEVVSSDFVGSRHACVFDSEATIVKGNTAVLYCWYDNEFGYSCQVHRILEQMAGVDYAVYPQD